MGDKAQLKRWRNAFREGVFARDGHRCVCCGRPAVDAHHITDRHDLPNDGYAIENGISLCAWHHRLAEVYNMASGMYWIRGYHPYDLYARIGSSRVLALEASARLR